MLDPNALKKVDGYCKASSRLMGIRDFEGCEARPVLFAGGERLTTHLFRAFCGSASAVGMDTVYLEFGSRIGAGPRRVQVMLPHDGKCYVFLECAFWAPEDHGPMVLVPLNGHESHFALTTDGLRQLAGKAAPSLAAGIERAARRLRLAARALETEAGTDCVWIHA